MQSRLEAAVNRLIVSQLWPWPSRAAMIGFLLVLSYFSLSGPADPRLNLATVFSWIIWWPLLAVSCFLFQCSSGDANHERMTGRYPTGSSCEL